MTEVVRETEGGALRLPGLLRRRWRSLTVAGAIAATGALALAGLSRPAAPDSRFAVIEREASAPRPPDPLMAALIRCRALPPQMDDPACRAAWEENRVRFFGERRAMRVPGDPLPTYAPIPTAGATPDPER